MATSARPLIIGVNTLYLRAKEVGGSEVYLREVLQHASAVADVRFVLFCDHAAAKSFESSAKLLVVESPGDRSLNYLVSGGRT